MKNEFEFKASTVELAVKLGLTKLGLKEDEVEVNVISEGNGAFTKACVILTPIVKEDVTNEVEEEVEVEVDQNSEKCSCEGGCSKNCNCGFNGGNKEFYQLLCKDGEEYLIGLLENMNLRLTVESKVKDDEISYYVGGEESKVVIGHRGETLDAIQFLVSQFINKNNFEDHIRVTVDADFYRERRKKTLTFLAKKVAHQAFNARRDMALEPMNSYERRIIHSALQDNAEATTYSEGEGKDRHVVISPKCEKIAFGTSTDFKRNGQGKKRSFGDKRRRF